MIVRASAGFASSSQRRGVTPLVLLLNRSGNISARSLTVVVRSNLEWIAATPLVLCEPTMARFAMRTCLVGPSSIRLIARHALLVAGEAMANRIEQAAIDLEDDLQVARQQHLEPGDRPFLQGFRQQVWFVYARVRCVRSQAWSQPRCASSSRMRISSGTAMLGCVSLS